VKIKSLHNLLALGEGFTTEFNADMKNAKSSASEMAAFANTGGMVLSGHVDPTNDLLDVRQRHE